MRAWFLLLFPAALAVAFALVVVLVVVLAATGAWGGAR